MHELYLAESIINIIKDYAVREGFQKVNSVLLSYGCLSCIEPNSLQFGFDVQARGTPAEGAKLEFQVLPAMIHCFSCKKDLVVKTHTGICPECNGDEVILNAGTEELQILELDVEL
jgi:hydrogenase nickel incorporation protein HypA/HybF